MIEEEDELQRFGLDFDRTLTACPKLWRSFINEAIRDGHKVTVVTARRDTPENRKIIDDWLEEHGFDLHVVYTNLRSKLKVAEERRMQITIWMDDDPHSLVNGH